MTTIPLPPDHNQRVNARQKILEAKYQSTYALTDPDKKSRALALLERIGTIDWKTEGYQSPDHQRDLSIKFHWGHDHRFDADLQVKGRMGNRHLSLAAQFMEGFSLPDNHFQGRAVLDIGCWTGGTTLVLAMLGASRVLALEEVRKYAEATNILATDIYGLSTIHCEPKSLFDLKEGRFDSVYIPGVVYHLSDPVLGLRRLFNRLRDGGDILIESAGIRHDGRMCRFKGNQEHFGGSEDGDMNRGGWAWFWPSASCLDAWMYEAGFDDIRVFYSEEGSRVFGYGKRIKYRDITRAGLSVPDIE